jgi:uncharacterized repeat protein (TIGR01451 family)
MSSQHYHLSIPSQGVFLAILVGIFAIGLSSTRAAGMFTDIEAGLPGVGASAAAWGDYDQDGDLDILIAGDTNSGSMTRIYQNDGGVFQDIGAGLPGISSGAIAWGDYDNDNDLDILLTGNSSSGPIAEVYENRHGTFVSIGSGFPGVANSSAAWGDYDSDGDLDLVLAGQSSLGSLTRVYRNDGGGAFTDINAGLPGLSFGAVAWGDYDIDGDLDLLLAGSSTVGRIARIYINGGGTFVDSGVTLSGVSQASAVWGDYDTDGDLDILLTGYTATDYITEIYRNEYGHFDSIQALIPGTMSTNSAGWGDYDTDGDLDILLAGYTASGLISRIYGNNSGVFADTGAGLAPVQNGAVAWGDYDGDHDLDVLLTGWTGTDYATKVYRNDHAVANTAPEMPVDLEMNMVGTEPVLSWGPAGDDHTPSLGLSYNLRIGTSPGGTETAAPMADIGSGQRYLVQMGTPGSSTSIRIKGLQPGRTYYWSVQAIDSSFEASAFAPEQEFTTLLSDSQSGLQGIQFSAAAWGDYDNDNDLDLLFGGRSSTGRLIQLCRNDNGSFQPISAGLPNIEVGSVAWGDYDNDNDLDILLSGSTTTSRIARVYRNTAGTFTDINAGLTGVSYSSAAWGDYDNDGDLDILLAGDRGTGAAPAPSTQIYRNNGDESFSAIGATLLGVRYASVAWGDYDEDGDLDILLSGSTNTGYSPRTRVYRNDGNGIFTQISAGLPDVADSAVAWGDYDSDGDLDILLSGNRGTGSDGLIARVYRNDVDLITGSRSFHDVNAGLQGMYRGAVAWGDYDNDGKLDILMAGVTVGEPVTRIYRNAGGSFQNINLIVPGVRHSALAWGDYDSDYDLDFFLAGQRGSSSTPVAHVYRNDSPTINTPPNAPRELSASLTDTVALLRWSVASDLQTAAPGLTYNLRVGTTPGGADVVSPMADASSGKRRVVQIGNVGQNTAATLHGLVPGQTYYWTVQTIDNAFDGSPFAAEGSFTVNTSPTLTINTGLVLQEGAAAPIAATNLEVTDEQQDASVLSYTLELTPTRGLLRRDTMPLRVGDSFTQADIDSGKLTYIHDGSETINDSFSFTIADHAGGLIGSTHFAIRIIAVNDMPTISQIGDQTTIEDAPVGGITLVLGDEESTPEQLVLSAISSDARLVPVQNIAFGGMGAKRTITIIPSPDMTGTATITITVSDGERSASTPFSLSVMPQSDLAVTAIAQPDSVKVGSLVTYTLTITNHGPSDAMGVVLSATLPMGTIMMPVTAEQGICTMEIATNCPIGTIAENARVTVTMQARATAAGMLISRARVTADEPDPDQSNNNANVSVVVTPNYTVYLPLSMRNENVEIGRARISRTGGSSRLVVIKDETEVSLYVSVAVERKQVVAMLLRDLEAVGSMLQAYYLSSSA